MIFAQYLDNHLKDFDATCSEVRQNGYKSDGLRYSGSYQAKSIKIAVYAREGFGFLYLIGTITVTRGQTVDPLASVCHKEWVENAAS